ncbi:MAG: fibronectin type III domain-containing protein [Anaerolineae bacterium]|nr:fibronectin type III domain-containing protein [Anaerolineae bacterium]
MSRSIPDPPLNISGAGLGGDRIELSWKPPPGATGIIFRVYWDKGLGYRMSALKTSLSGSHYVVRGLKPATTYLFLVTTYNGEDESGPVTVEVRTRSWLQLSLARLMDTTPGSTLRPATPAPTSTAANEQQSIRVSEVMLGLMGVNDYVDDLGTLHLVGEVHNDADQYVDQIRVAVTFYDDAGNVLHSVTGASLLDLLGPGQLSPFAVVWEAPDEWKRYSLRASARPTTRRPVEGFTLVHSYARLDEDGFYHVVGTIRNDGLTTADYLRVVVSLYDSFGKISNAGFAYAQPPRIPPGATGFFDCPFEYFPYRAEHMVQIAHR